MKDTIGTLRARIAALGDTWTDGQGTVHERPTAWAYAQACAALDKWRQRAEVAEAALRQIADNAEASYWELRHWLDSGPDCREWVHGDDGPAYPFMQLAKAARVVVEGIQESKK